MKAHAARRTMNSAPTAKKLEGVTKHLLKMYPRVTGSTAWLRSPERLRLRLEHMARFNVNPKAFPGYPWCQFGKTNAEVLETQKETIFQAVELRIAVLMSMTEKDFESPVYQKFACDPIRYMIKREHHPLRKREKKTWRLIGMVSLVDQMVDRLLHAEVNGAEITRHRTIPSQPGIGFDDSELEYISKRVFGLTERSGAAVASYDVSGWDWTMQAWEFHWDLSFRYSQMNCGTPELAHLMINRARACFMSPALLPDGHLVYLQLLGLMVSGLYHTSSTNSRVRACAAFLAGALWAITMGDDCAESERPGAIEAYALQGRTIRTEGEPSKEEFSFCSHTFKRGQFGYLDSAKFILNFLESDRSPEHIEAVRRNLRHHPQRDVVLKLLNL